MQEIPYIPGYYASKEGFIFNSKGHQLKGGDNRKGYLHANLGGTTYRVHRLVAMTFIPNPHNYPYVLHKDNNRKNNHTSNLYWGTQSDNMKQAVRDGRVKNFSKGKFGKDHFNSKEVIQYTREGEFIARYDSARLAQEATGISNTNISSCCNGKLKAAGGFVWKINNPRM